MSIRPVKKLIQSKPTLEGAGVHLRRAFGFGNTSDFDPFLLLDDFRNDVPEDYLAGFPWHPHRGIETITYVLAGTVEHGDSMGNRGAIAAGDVQWMTAGSGVVHSEMPSEGIRQRGGRIHGFQVWVNLPARDKMMTPRYQEVPAARIPQAATSDGRANVRVIAGEALGVRAVIDTRTPIVYQDWKLRPGALVEQPLAEGHHALVYVFEGSVEVGSDQRSLRDGELGLLGPGTAVRLAVPSGASAGARLLLLAGQPLREPVARYGPFVMNTESEIQQAFSDYRSGRFAEIRRS
jgi:quercetin 2,3-dioxygenase